MCCTKRRVGDLGFVHQRVERDQEPPDVAVLIQPEGVEHRAQAVEDQVVATHTGEALHPRGAAVLVEQVERADVAAQGDHVGDRAGVADVLVAQPLRTVFSLISSSMSTIAFAGWVDGEVAEERFAVGQGADEVADQGGFPALYCADEQMRASAGATSSMR